MSYCVFVSSSPASISYKNPDPFCNNRLSRSPGCTASSLKDWPHSYASIYVAMRNVGFLNGSGRVVISRQRSLALLPLDRPMFGCMARHCMRYTDEKWGFFRKM